MDENRKHEVKAPRIWPIKSDKNPAMRLSKKSSGYTRCAFCNNKITEGEVTFLINPINEVAGIRLHINCIGHFYKELSRLRRNNIKTIIAEQLCPITKTTNQTDDS